MKPDMIHTALEPQDLEFLQACFDAIRRERGLTTEDAAANALAAQMIELYQTGVRDARDLSALIGA